MKHLLLIVLIFLFILAPAARADDSFPPAALPLYRGVDVSTFQGDIDFAQVRASGVEIAYLRAGVGNNYTDPRFEQNYAAAKAAGLKLGAYFFMTATTADEVRSQAAFFARLVAGKTFDCRLALDFGQAGQLTDAEATAYALLFLEEVEALTGLGAMLYTDASGARDKYGDALVKFPIWVADYDNVREPEPNGKWSAWAGWQYSDVGRIDGIRGDVDLDRFNDLALLTTLSPTPVPTPTPAPTPTPVPGATWKYVVQSGDTLTRIASRFGTTARVIADANGIELTATLYPGWILLVPRVG